MMEKLRHHIGKINFSAKLLSAYLSILSERLFFSFIFFLLWLGAFLCLWTLGFYHHHLTVIFWIGSLVLFLAGIGQFKPVSQRDAVRRLETDSALSHRPLTGQSDRIATEGNSDLWTLEKNRQKNLLSRLRFSKPFFDISARDPYSLRILILLVLFCTYFVSPQLWRHRIAEGLTLQSADHKQDKAGTESFAQLRITPPPYAGMKPLLLNKASDKAVEILAGSRIEADIRSPHAQPVLKMGDKAFQFNRKDEKSVWKASVVIPQTDHIRITTYDWPRFSQEVNWLDDKPPVVSWKTPPLTLPSGETRITLKVTDDFGIKKVILRAILAPDEKRPRFGRDLMIERNVSLPVRNQTADVTSVFDLTGHPWAGLKVSLLAEVEDFAGNISGAEPVDIIIPTRKFRNPAAEKISQVRNSLLNNLMPLEDLVRGIETVLFNPQTYGWDPIVTLSLRSAGGRLYYSQNIADQESAAATLWSAALRIENGATAETAKSLQSALEKLQEALQNGDKEQAAQLMQQFLQALGQHIQALAQKIRNSNQDMMTQSLNMKSIDDFLKKLQSDIQNGNMEEAMKKLGSLQQLTDFMNTSMTQGVPENIQEMMKELEKFQQLVDRQKKLLDDTRAQPDKFEEKSKEQRAINSETPGLPPLQPIKTEMDQSAAALDGKDAPTSVGHQEKILDQLKNQSKQKQQQLEQALQQMMSLSAQQPASRDPLGKSQSGLSDENIEIPDGQTPKRADQIIKTLRERSGDMSRPLDERNYYQRLLKEW